MSNPLRAEKIALPKIEDPRGNLSFIEENSHIPFTIKRSYLIYDVPGGAIRGGHAFLEQQEFIVALSGSFTVRLNYGDQEECFTLNRSYYGIYIPKLVWRSLEDFSTNSLCLVLASTSYNPNDYIRDFEDFLQMKL